MNRFTTRFERLLLSKNSMFLVMFAVLLAHASSIAGDFVWDDTYNIEENEEIRSLSNIPGFFTKAWGASAPEESRAREKNKGLYRPLALVCYTIDHAIFGLSPWAFHLSNLLIHLLSSLMVLLLARRFCGPGVGLLVALIWAIHPVHTETISVISYRTTLLAGLFGFASLYVQIIQEHLLKRVVFRTLLVGLACFAKEDGIIFAAILPLHDVLIRRESFKKATLYALPLLGFALLFFFLRSQILEPGIYAAYGGVSGGQHLAGVMQSTWLYTQLLVVPYPLTPFYGPTVFVIPDSWLVFEVLAGLLVSCLLLVTIVRFKNAPHRAFLASALVLSLLPYTHILPFAVPAAERFIYVPSFFALLLFAHLIVGLEGRFTNHQKFRKATISLVVLWLIPCTAWSALRHRDWQSQLHITEATTEDFPNSFNAWRSYGDALDVQGHKEAAANAYARAGRCAPFPLATIREVEIRLELKQSSEALLVIQTYLKTYGERIEQLAKDPHLGHLKDELDHLKALQKRLQEH